MLERTDSTGAAPRSPGVPAVSLPVPEGFLRLPLACDWQQILRYESGMALDPHLRRLSRLSGAIDRGLALRLLALHRSSGYLRLGRACFGDYARERVGVAERTAQEWVRLGRGLERLPLLDDALHQGRVTWTAAAQVARIAGTEDQADWVALAERLSVRELKVRVDDALKQGRSVRAEADLAVDSTAAPTDGPESNREASGMFDLEADDRPVKLHLFSSKRTAHLWEAVLELCELVAGSSLSPSEAPEYIVADFLSGTEPAGKDVRAFPAHPPRKHGYCGLHPKGSRRVTYLSGPTQELGDKRVAFAPAELSPEILRVLQLVDGEIPRNPVELDASVQALMAARRGLDLDLARLLRIFQWLGLARHLGFGSFTAYVEERLNISADRARFLVRLDRSLTEFKLTQDAVRQGRIGSVAAICVSRVASPGRIEVAWLERARQVSVVRLRKEVRWAERRNTEGSFRTTLPPSTGPLPSALQTLTMALLADEETKLHPFEGSRAWIRSEDCQDNDANGPKQDCEGRETFAAHGSGESRCHGDDYIGHVDGEAMAEAIRVFRELMASDEGPEGDCAVEFWLRQSALDLWTEVRRRLSVAAGRSWISDAEVLHEIALAFLLTHLRPWLEAVRTGDPTAVRDRFVCQVPGCTMRAGAGHHLRFRSDLGPDELWNLLFICWGHHLIGIHGGPWIRVTGRAPDALKAELGLLPEGKALETWIRAAPSGAVRASA